MEIKVLASSSAGNSYFITDTKTNLLLECGVSLNVLRKKGINPTTLHAALITHEHLDHSKYAKDIAKYCNIYSTKETLDTIACGIYSFRKKPIHKEKVIGTFKVRPFRVYHDAINPVGYYLYSTYTKESLLFITDTHELLGLKFRNSIDYILIETNYSEELMKDFESYVNERRKVSHLSLEQATSFLKTLDLTKTKEIYLIHLSDSFTDEKMFREEVAKATGKRVIIAPKR